MLVRLSSIAMPLAIRETLNHCARARAPLSLSLCEEIGLLEEEKEGAEVHLIYICAERRTGMAWETLDPTVKNGSSLFLVDCFLVLSEPDLRVKPIRTDLGLSADVRRPI